jgi:hypothetical protein
MKTNTRPIHEIARDVNATWSKVSPYAQPYLDAMSYLTTINDDYYLDSGRSVVLYFLSNAASWRGDDARRIKKELKEML